MPFVGYDKWEDQYFAGVQQYASEVLIPCGDTEAYPLYPQYQWAYNKLELCRAQNLRSAPLGVDPPKGEEVFVKPIVNLCGLAAQAYREADPDYYPGLFWMELLKGTQTSTDVVVIKGQIRWAWTMRPLFDSKGWLYLWEHWTSTYAQRDVMDAWCKRRLRWFTGVMNFEMIGDIIIEAPLRLSPQWVDLYGNRWLRDVAALYKTGRWTYPNGPLSTYSRVVRTERRDAEIHQLREAPRLPLGVTSYQLPWKEGANIADLHDSDSSVRVAVINGVDRKAVDAYAEQLTLTIGIG